MAEYRRFMRRMLARMSALIVMFLQNHGLAYAGLCLPPKLKDRRRRRAPAATGAREFPWPDRLPIGVAVRRSTFDGPRLHGSHETSGGNGPPSNMWWNRPS